MVMVKDETGVERFSMPEEHYKLAMRCRQKIQKEDAMVLGIIWGGVGCGKSVWAQHFGYTIDPTLDVSRVCFDKDEFVDAVLGAKKQVIIADEGIAIFFSRAAMTKESRLVQELMAQIRQKNLCVLICVPNLLSIDSLMLEAANFGAYVWESRETIAGKAKTLKGNAALYPRLPSHNYLSKIIHYLKSKRRGRPLKKVQPVYYVKGNPIGDEYKKPWYPVGEKAYRAKKEAILDKYRAPMEKKVEMKKTKQTLRMEFRRKAIYDAKKKDPGLTFTELAKAHGITRQSASNLYKDAVNLWG